MTGRKECLPICVECLGYGKKVVTFGKKNEVQTKKEKRGKAELDKAAKNKNNK